MRESFTEYKKTLEQNLVNISFLYSGDIISSTQSHYVESKTTPLTSPTFIVSSIIDIYNKSFQMLKEKSKEFVIPEESISGVGINGNLFDKIFEQGIKPVYIFCSEKGKTLFGNIFKGTSTSAFPPYFYPIDKFVGINVDIFYSPLIEEDIDEIVLYVADAPIQSLVYSIQNMDYQVDPIGEIEGFIPNIPSKWSHKITYSLYDCNFNAYKLSIRNVSRLRQDKINRILNDD